MKLPSAAPSTLLLLLLNGASSQTCPGIDEYSTMTLDDGSLTFKYAIVLGDRPILCARLESDASSVGRWMGFGISPSGEMDSESDIRSTGIIGLPEDDTVQKYWLTDEHVNVMDSDPQTLMNATMTTDADGATIMSFAKYLAEDGEFEIFPSGNNTFLYALGSDGSLGFHASSGAFILDFDTEEGFEMDEEDEEEEEEEHEDDASSPSVPADDGTSVPPPVPEGTSTTSSGIAMMRMARSMVVGAGVYAVWIGM